MCPPQPPRQAICAAIVNTALRTSMTAAASKADARPTRPTYEHVCKYAHACILLCFSVHSLLTPRVLSVHCAKPRRGLRGQVCRTRPLARRSHHFWTPVHTCAQVSRCSTPCSSRVFSALGRSSPALGPWGWAGVRHPASIPPVGGAAGVRHPARSTHPTARREADRPVFDTLLDLLPPSSPQFVAASDTRLPTVKKLVT